MKKKGHNTGDIVEPQITVPQNFYQATEKTNIIDI